MQTELCNRMQDAERTAYGYNKQNSAIQSSNGVETVLVNLVDFECERMMFPVCFRVFSEVWTQL